MTGPGYALRESTSLIVALALAVQVGAVGRPTSAQLPAVGDCGWSEVALDGREDCALAGPGFPAFFAAEFSTGLPDAEDRSASDACAPAVPKSRGAHPRAGVRPGLERSAALGAHLLDLISHPANAPPRSS